jgi:serine protease Do
LLYSLITAAQATPGDDEPKTPTVEVRLPQDVKVAPEDGVEVQPDHRFLFYTQQAYDPRWSTVSVNNDQVSDLDLAAADDALRSQLKLPKDRGLVATSVREHGPAWQAGIRDNDILLTLDDAPLAKPEDLDQKLKDAAEKTVSLTLMRKGKTITMSACPKVSVSLGPLPAEQSEYWIGLAYAPVAPALRDQLDLPPYAMTISQVYPESPAAKNGVKANDVLLTVGTDGPNKDSSVHWGDAKKLHELVQKNGGSEMRLNLLRDGGPLTITLTPEKRKTGQTFHVNFVPNNLIGTTVVHPGVVQNGPSDGWSQGPNGSFSGWTVKNVVPTPDASSKRIDEMAAEIKDLREAIDGLTKALEARK